MNSIVQERREWLGHDYTKCPKCINRVRYCGCFTICMCCEKHATDCKNEYCKNCRKKGRHTHDNGQIVHHY